MKENDKELVPLVDEKGNVTGCATRSEVHNGSMLLHPVVHLHLFNREGQLFLQRRPAWKTIQPGKWDTAVGGHVDFGEEIPVALRRETLEEIGMTQFHAVHVVNYVFESAVEKELVNVFAAKATLQNPVPSAELDGGRFWDLSEIEEAIGKNILTPNFENEYLRILKPRLAQILEDI